ncbi:MAG: hypothetical protein V1897_17270, partial [Pseudomonadota bacterium]
MLPILKKKLQPTRPDTTWVRKWGGVVQDSSPEVLPPGMLIDALNYEIDGRSGLAPRTGFGLYSATTAPDGRPIRTIFVADFDGTYRVLVATDQNVYEFTYSTDTWTHVYARASGTKKMLFCMLNSAFAPI